MSNKETSQQPSKVQITNIFIHHIYKVHKYKNQFFLLSGIYSLYLWNSILSLNGYFENAYKSDKISLDYSLISFVGENIAMVLSYYITIHANIYTISKYAFYIIYILFHALYFISEFISSKLIIRFKS